MTFNTIYDNRQKFFPKEIDISDGRLIDTTDGFVSDNLSKLWNEAEDVTSNHAEGHFVWAYYRVIHRLAKKTFANGDNIIFTESIPREELHKEYKIVLDEAEKVSNKNFCCDMMANQINHNCDIHDSKYDCADNLMDYNDDDRTYRLLIHDGGSSGIEIRHCPWCGQKL